MITDAQTRFSAAQALTTGTQTSTNAYDLGLARDVGRGRQIRIIATINQAFAGGTSVQANIVQSPNPDLSGATVLESGPVVAEASLTPGTKLIDAVLPRTSQRYIGVQYTNVGLHTSGAVDAGMVLDTDSLTFFASNTGY